MSRIAVIGAGAAGISAARALVQAGVNVTVFEARSRIGGRVWTDTAFASFPVEFGAEFVHGERVTTWDWIRGLDAPVSGAAHAYERWYDLGGHLVDHAAATAVLGVDPMRAMEQLTQGWVDSGREETSLDRVFELWLRVSEQPLTSEGRALIENIFAELVASDADQLGTHRMVGRKEEQPETLRHFRLVDGYSALFAKAASGLRVVLDMPVRAIHWDESAVELVLPTGRERFDAAVVTLPLGILAAGEVDVNPALPASTLDAIRRINPGHISKVILRLDRVYWPPDMTFLATPRSSQFWWQPGLGRQGGEPALTAFFGGKAARALEGAKESDAIAEVSRQLGEILGQSMESHVLAGRYIAWGAEPYTRMGYSSLPPHGRGIREALGEPVGALYFAGEATSVDHPATVHGAIESGRRAAAQLLGTRR